MRAVSRTCAVLGLFARAAPPRLPRLDAAAVVSRSSPVAIFMTLTALPIKSAGRFPRYLG